MTGGSTDPRPFRPDELEGADGLRPEELGAEARIARDLEALAARSGAAPAPDFVDRVMVAVAKEPAPAPVRAAGIALRRGALIAFLASLRDAFDVALRPGFPMAVRAQAVALVLVVGGLAAGSGLAAAGAVGLFGGNQGVASPGPTDAAPSQPAPSAPPPSQLAPSAPPVSASPAIEPSAQPDGSLRPGLTAEPEATDDDGSGGPDDTSAAPTKKPTRTPTPTPTDDDHEDDTPEPSRTPKPSETPEPSETPDHTDEPDH